MRTARSFFLRPAGATAPAGPFVIAGGLAFTCRKVLTEFGWRHSDAHITKFGFESRLHRLAASARCCAENSTSCRIARALIFFDKPLFGFSSMCPAADHSVRSFRYESDGAFGLGLFGVSIAGDAPAKTFRICVRSHLLQWRVFAPSPRCPQGSQM